MTCRLTSTCVGATNRHEQQHGSFQTGRPEDFVEARKYSEATARDIDQSVLGIIKASFDNATAILGDRRELLTKCAQQLLEHETLSREALLLLLDKDSSGPKLVKNIEPG
jgi:ATP-dependent Zn protease